MYKHMSIYMSVHTFICLSHFGLYIYLVRSDRCCHTATEPPEALVSIVVAMERTDLVIMRTSMFELLCDLILPIQTCMDLWLSEFGHRSYSWARTAVFFCHPSMSQNVGCSRDVSKGYKQESGT